MEKLFVLGLALLAPALAFAQAPPVVPAANSAALAAEPVAVKPRHISNHDRDRAQRYFMQGGKAVLDSDMAAAVDAFSHAQALDPTDADYDAALAIARDNYATQLVQQGLKARFAGDRATFLQRMRQAAAEDSHNPLVMQHAQDFANDVDVQEAATLGPQTEVAPPIVLELAHETHSFHLRAPEGDVVRQVMQAYGITPMIDKSVGNEFIPFDVDDVTFDQAEAMLTLTTNSFVVPLDPHRALLALDTTENRQNFERLAEETLYVPALDQNDISDLVAAARNVFQAKQVTSRPANGTITVRMPQRQMQAFNYQVNDLMAGRSEVTLQVDMYEIQRNYTMNAGVELPQTSTVFNVDSQIQSLLTSNASLVQEIISSGLASSGNLEEIALALVASGEATGSSLLENPFAVFGGGLTLSALQLNGATANGELQDTVSKMLDSTSLRLEDKQEGVLKVGESYPIVTSSFSNLVTGSTSIPGITTAGTSSALASLGLSSSALASAASATVPQVQYQDIGLNLTATPTIEMSGTVSLKLHFALSSLSGQTLNSNPVINNRQVDSVLAVQPGEQTVVMSQLSNQESSTLVGFPGLSEIPGFPLFTNVDKTRTQDTLVIVITPHVVRLGHPHLMNDMVRLPAHS